MRVIQETRTSQFGSVMEIPRGEITPGHLEVSTADDGSLGQDDFLKGPFSLEPRMLEDEQSCFQARRSLLALTLGPCWGDAVDAGNRGCQ